MFNEFVQWLKITSLFLNAAWSLLNNENATTTAISHTMEKYACITRNIISSLLKELSSNQLQTQPQSIIDGSKGATNNNKIN